MSSDPPTLSIATAVTRELPAAARQEIVRMCTAAHGVDFGELFAMLPPDGIHVLGRLADRLLGHAVITTRWLQPAGLPLLRTAYIDAVATDPEYQGRGVGSAVMRAVAAAADAARYEIAGLQTDDRAAFYERLGWQRWRGPLAGRSADGLIPTPDEYGVLILRLALTPPLDLHGLLTIEQSGRIW